MNLTRQPEDKIKSHFDRYKQALVLLGPRQVGKTTLLKRIFPKATYLLLDEKPIQDILETYSIGAYKQIIGDSKMIILDELHLLSNPGRAVKLVYDQLKDIKIAVTGSSSLQISNKASESMAGRAIRYHLYPLTFSEYLYQSGIGSEIDSKILYNILNSNNSIEVKRFDQQAILENVLNFGLYPHTIQTPRDKLYLKNLSERAIFRDVLELNLIENRSKASDLLRLLAYQIGNLVNYSEIGNRLSIAAETVKKYIDIFEQSFILYRLNPFSKHKRDEIGKSPKIYFYDLGIRNSLIDNFDSMKIRSDSGALFENFIINEIKKLIDYEELDWKMNYWRLKSGQEVDLVLSNNKDLIGCEIKYGGGRITSSFKNRYPEAHTHTINTENFY